MVKKYNKRPARDFTGVPGSVLKTINKNNKNSENAFLASCGVGSTLLREAQPHYNKADNETLIQGNNSNVRIVLGKDRGKHGTKWSGYGGKGDTGAGTLDFVVGGGSTDQGTKEELGFGTPTMQRVLVNPSFIPHVSKKSKGPKFVTDKARLFIGEKTDPDENFNLLERKSGVPPTKAKSAAVLKSDKTVILGNEGVVISTNTDGYNSRGGRIESTPGIDLVAGNRGKFLQPLVKGHSLTQALSRILDEIRDLNSIVLGAVYEQMHMNHVFGNHFHPPPILLVNVLPEGLNMDIAFDTNSKLNNLTVQSLQNQMDNLQRLEDQFCSTNGKTYVCSRYNKTN